MAESERSPWLNRRLSDSAPSWTNRRGRSDQIDDNVTAKMKSLGLSLVTVDSDRRGRMEDITTTVSKALRLGLIMAELERSSSLRGIHLRG